MNIELHICYFCEINYPYPSCFISNHDGLWICYHCSDLDIEYTESPDWPYEFNDDDNDPERIKYEEYCDFENLHFDIETKNYDELIEIRNSLISQRPEWMNSSEFINYENTSFRYHTECIKLDREWEEYNETKTKGNSICPLCRAKP